MHKVFKNTQAGAPSGTSPAEGAVNIHLNVQTLSTHFIFITSFIYFRFLTSWLSIIWQRVRWNMVLYTSGFYFVMLLCTIMYFIILINWPTLPDHNEDIVEFRTLHHWPVCGATAASTAFPTKIFEASVFSFPFTIPFLFSFQQIQIHSSNINCIFLTWSTFLSSSTVTTNSLEGSQNYQHLLAV